MTIPRQPPVDPDAVAEVAPGQGPEPGSAYYGEARSTATVPGRACRPRGRI